ncbi:hypothetical protein B0H14DRAFT_3135317 [Mycena olivaceomarginata]|nr:hypothetical protein B0H14DRAFT_3135317 [Mycena olivaceomarginata]
MAIGKTNRRQRKEICNNFADDPTPNRTGGSSSCLDVPQNHRSAIGSVGMPGARGGCGSSAVGSYSSLCAVRVGMKDLVNIVGKLYEEGHNFSLGPEVPENLKLLCSLTTTFLHRFIHHVGTGAEGQAGGGGSAQDRASTGRRGGVAGIVQAGRVECRSERGECEWQQERGDATLIVVFIISISISAATTSTGELRSSSRAERRKDIPNAGDEKHEENEVQDPGPQTNTGSQRLNAQWMRADRTTPTPTRTCTCVHAMNVYRHSRPQPPASAAPGAKHCHGTTVPE